MTDEFEEWILKNPVKALKLIGLVVMCVGAFTLFNVRFYRQPTMTEVAIAQLPAVMWVVGWMLVIWLGSRLITRTKGAVSPRTKLAICTFKQRVELPKAQPSPPEARGIFNCENMPASYNEQNSTFVHGINL